MTFCPAHADHGYPDCCLSALEVKNQILRARIAVLEKAGATMNQINEKRFNLNRDLGAKVAALEEDRTKLREAHEWLSGEFWDEECGEIGWGDWQDEMLRRELLVGIPGDEAYLVMWGPGAIKYVWAWSDAARKGHGQ